MSIWPKKTRTKILLALVVALVAIYTWQANPREPTVVMYCTKYQGTPPARACVETKRLSIPAAFGNVTVADSLYELEFAYPSMQPWRSVSWLERSNTQKLTIWLHGVTLQTTQDIFASYFPGTPKPVHVAAIYGLDQYTLEGWGKRQLLLPIESSPRLFMDCAYGDDLNDLQGGNPYACTTTSYTNWHLKFVYTHQRALLPEWRTVHAKVHAFVESLVTTP